MSFFLPSSIYPAQNGRERIIKILQQNEWRGYQEKRKWTTDNGQQSMATQMMDMDDRNGRQGRREQRCYVEEEHWRQRILEQRGGGCRGPSSRSFRRQMVVSVKELPIQYGTVTHRPSSQIRHFPPPPPPPRPSSSVRSRHPPPPLASPHPPRQFIQHHPLPPITATPPPLPPNSPPSYPVYHSTIPHGGWVSHVEEKQTEVIEEKRTKEWEEPTIDPDKEIINEPHGFRIQVGAKGFDEADVKMTVDQSRVLTLDAQHTEESGPGIVTLKKLSRQWKLSDDVDLHSLRSFLAADGILEISGTKGMAQMEQMNGKEKQPQIPSDHGPSHQQIDDVRMQGQEDEAGEEEEAQRRQSLHAMPPTPIEPKFPPPPTNGAGHQF